MPPYSFISTGRLFDLVLPKPVIDICSKANPGDCSQFHFVESMDNVFSSKSKPTLSITNLDDGSWNITNKKDVEHNLNVKHVYFIVTTENAENQDQPSAQAETIDVKPTEKDMEVDNAEDVKVPEIFEDRSSAEEPFKEEWTDNKYAQEEITPEPPEEEHLQHTPENLQPEGHPQNLQEPLLEPQLLADPGQLSAGSQAQYTVEASQNEPNINDHDYSGATDDDEMSSEEEIIENSLRENMATPKTGVHCSICPSIIKDNWNLLKHIKRYHQEHPTYWALVAQIKPLLRVRCEQCCKLFGNRKILVEHEQKVHHTSIGATCTHCGKFFKTEQHMRIHVKYMHLRQPGTYLCDLCPSKFNTRNVLREHIKYSHSSVDRSNKCTECDFVYAFKKQFYEHFTRVHAPKKHTCPYCDYKCATKWYMKKHTKNCAPKTYHMSQDEVSESTQATQENLTQHSVDLSQVLRQVQQIEERDSEGIQVQQLEDGNSGLRTWQVIEEAKPESNQGGYESLHAEHVQIGDQNNQTVGMIEVSGEKRQRISLTAADGSQQTIELILPK